MAEKNEDVTILMTSNIYDIEAPLEAVCNLVSIKYRNIMSLEHMDISNIPEGIF
jgi:hypothetical protein